jgi:hypothetical protein
MEKKEREGEIDKTKREGEKRKRGREKMVLCNTSTYLINPLVMKK